jgi:hypothetical protein
MQCCSWMRFLSGGGVGWMFSGLRDDEVFGRRAAGGGRGSHGAHYGGKHSVPSQRLGALVLGLGLCLPHDINVHLGRERAGRIKQCRTTYYKGAHCGILLPT